MEPRPPSPLEQPCSLSQPCLPTTPHQAPKLLAAHQLPRALLLRVSKYPDHRKPVLRLMRGRGEMGGVCGLEPGATVSAWCFPNLGHSSNNTHTLISSLIF